MEAEPILYYYFLLCIKLELFYTLNFNTDKLNSYIAAINANQLFSEEEINICGMVILFSDIQNNSPIWIESSFRMYNSSIFQSIYDWV